MEQDAAYWEAHVDLPDGMSVGVLFGVATKKDRKFYADGQDQDEGE